MFTVNQTNREERIASLPDDDIIVLFDRKCVFMCADGARLPRAAELRTYIGEKEQLVLGGNLNGHDCWGMQAAAVPPGLLAVECRNVFVTQEAGVASAVSRCRELAEWRSRHIFCGRCGGRMDFSSSDLAAKCDKCGALYYPQIAPAVIVAILRGNELLLANNRRFTDRVYSLIAGFVEAGESVEEAVHREIFEETNLRVKNLRYLYSQPWPFPNSLMLGLTAEYDSGEPVPNDGELTDIQWFPLDRLPRIPAPGSIAHRMITQISKSQST
ncbi:MAG: NAD(+) diphosphatase [Victivallales bacterium]|nr:NAD(+) diphosphatase [Victivallales bacterium]